MGNVVTVEAVDLKPGDIMITLDDSGQPQYNKVLSVAPDMTCGAIEYKTARGSFTVFGDTLENVIR